MNYFDEVVVVRLRLLDDVLRRRFEIILLVQDECGTAARVLLLLLVVGLLREAARTPSFESVFGHRHLDIPVLANLETHC